MSTSRLNHVLGLVLILGAAASARSDTISLLGYWEVGSCNGLELQDGRLYHGNGPHLEIADLAVPHEPAPLGRVLLPSRVEDVVVDGDIAYVAATYFGLQVVDVSDPHAPVVLATLQPGTRATAVAIDRDVLYLVDTYDGMFIVDVADPTAPTVIHHLDPEPFPQDAVVAGKHLYLSTWNGIFIYDVTVPAQPIWRATIADGAYYGYEGITYRDDLIYVAARQGGLRTWDVSDPVHPVYLDDYNVSDQALDVDLLGNLAVVTCYHSGLRLVDVTKPNNLVLVSEFDPPGSSREVLCQGGLAYVAAGGDGVQVIDLGDPVEPVVVGCCPVGGPGVGIAVQGGVAYAVESNGGLRTHDVTDPAAPTPLGYFDLQAYPHDIALDGDHAYVTCHDGLRVIDVTDPALPRQVAVADVPGDDCGGVALGGALACINAYGNGLHVIDVSDPCEPRPFGHLPLPGSQGVAADEHHAYLPVTDYHGDRGGLYVIDHTVPGTPEIVGHLETFKAISIELDPERDLVYFYGRGQGGLTGLVVADVADPTDPREIGFLHFDWPVYSMAATGSHIYVWIGFQNELLAIDVADPTQPQVVAEYTRAGWHAYCLDAADGLLYANGVWVLRHDTLTGLAPPAVVAIHLEQNHPNPFNPLTSIGYRLPAASAVRLGVFDVRGRLVRRLCDGQVVAAGRHSVTWDGRDDGGRAVAAGTYLYRLEAGGVREARSLVLVR